MKRILNKIKAYQTIIIHGHKRPDGDCLGAQFGLKNIIKASFPSKEVYVVGQESGYIHFLGKVDQIDDQVYQNALVIVVDTATQERISDPRYHMGKELIKIDHHISVDPYGDLRWVDTNFPSCAQMITYFYYKFKNELTLNKEGATALYTGIVTDTGRFRFRGVTRLTHQLVGILLDHGVDIEYVDAMLSKETLDILKVKGYVYSHFITTEGGFVYIKFTREVLDQFNVSDEDAAAMVNLLGGIEGYPIWALFIEYPNEIRVRLRSSGPNIDRLANLYHGGGHAKAAGAKLENWRQLDDFIKDAEKTIKEA